MSVRQHLLATLAACFAITLAATLALHLGQRREIRGLTQNLALERSEQLAYVANEFSANLALFVTDYSGWDEMVTFAKDRDPEWARLNLVEVMPRFHASAIWVVATDGSVLYQSIADSAPPGLAPPPLSAVVSTFPWSRDAGGFYRSGEHLVDLRARAIQPTYDTRRVTRPSAWLLAARVLDADTAAELGRKLQARVALRLPGSAPSKPTAGGLTVTRALPPIIGDVPVGEWSATFQIAALELGENYNRDEMLVLVCSGLLLFSIVAWSINRNVLRPLEHIGESLRSDSPAGLDAISERLPEFARIAELVRQSFWQREALRREIEERVRLGRDLHDGVIQNLYATGMGLAHSQRLVHTAPDNAATRLEEARRTLNLTMDTLRGYITRAEPEASGNVELADACITLFQTLRADRACELDLDIATGIDARIPDTQKANLLFIIREAVSNSLRHSGAGRIGITLQVAGQSGRLRILDDGCGCDFATVPATGCGLKNIRARSRNLGGEPIFSSPSKGGVEITLEWPLSRRTDAPTQSPKPI
jgi:signal transduction histidine kinase